MKKEFINNRTLIIFTGGPGTGKSETSDRFLQFLDNDEIVKISYDNIKEKNWDKFGFDNENQKERLNMWSLEEFYLSIQNAMWKNDAILIEYPFYQRHRPKLRELIRESGYVVVTIYLFTDMQTVYQRGVTRDQQDNRHPGHLLSQYHIQTYTPKLLELESRVAPTRDELIASISHKEYNMKLGLTIEIDVTDFSKVSYEEIYEEIIDVQTNCLGTSRKNDHSSFITVTPQKS